LHSAAAAETKRENKKKKKKKKKEKRGTSFEGKRMTFFSLNVSPPFSLEFRRIFRRAVTLPHSGAFDAIATFDGAK